MTDLVYSTQDDGGCVILISCTHCILQVTSAHKRHKTSPHCIFAIDNLVQVAINLALAITSPGKLWPPWYACMLIVASCYGYLHVHTCVLHVLPML